MTKHADVLKAALEKKHAAAHPDAADSQAGKAKKPGKMGGAPASKPMKKVTGRGR